MMKKIINKKDVSKNLASLFFSVCSFFFLGGGREYGKNFQFVRKGEKNLKKIAAK